MAHKNILNRAVEVEKEIEKPLTVKVRATAHIGEDIGGVMRRFAPGEVFEVSPDRASAIAHSVELVK